MSALNLGAYRAGFATTQAAYEEAVYAFFAALDDLEAHFGAHRYLVGDRPTEADWRLFWEGVAAWDHMLCRATQATLSAHWLN